MPAALVVAGPFVAGQISRIAETPHTMTLVITMLIVLALCEGHGHWGTNRRMDAMLRLIKEQSKERDRANEALRSKAGEA